jgi:hypothetical protein
MLIGTISALLARRVGAAMLGGAILWAVARQAGPRDCEAVIHVAEAALEVRVDGWAYPHGDARSSPIVCDLRPGRHTLTVLRAGSPVHQGTFDLDPGDHIVLTAMDDAWLKAEIPDEARAGISAAVPAPATPRRR